MVTLVDLPVKVSHYVAFRTIYDYDLKEMIVLNKHSLIERKSSAC